MVVITTPPSPSFGVTVDAEAGMTADSQCWGPATMMQPIAHAPMRALVTAYERCTTQPCGQGRCAVCNWGPCTVYL